MPARFDLEDRLIGQLGTAVAVPCGQLGQGGQHVELGQHRAGLDQTGRLGRDTVAQGRVQLVFQLVSPLLGTEDFFFVLLELRRDVPLGVLDRLLADVVARDARAAGVGLGVRDLDVIAEDLVEADLEAGYPRLADLLGLELGDPGLAAAGMAAKLVELGMITVADQAAFLDRQRRIVDQGGLDLGADLRAELQGGLELVEPLRDPRGEPGLELRQQGKRPGQCDQVAGRGATRSRPVPPAVPGRTTG